MKSDLSKRFTSVCEEKERIEAEEATFDRLIRELGNELKDECKPVAIVTQSAEFLDCLLRSSIEFVLATVRHYDHDEKDTYRLRVVSKEGAREDRERYNMEFRA